MLVLALLCIWKQRKADKIALDMVINGRNGYSDYYKYRFLLYLLDSII